MTKKRATTSSPKDFFSRLKLVFSNPEQLFKNVSSEKGISTPFIFLLKTSVISAVLYILLLIFAEWRNPYNLYQTNPLLRYFVFRYFNDFGIYLGLITISIGFIVLQILSSFVNSGILHLFVKLFKGTGSYVETYKASAYQSALTIFGTLTYLFLFIQIPFLGKALYYLATIAFAIWGIYILITGISTLHKLSKGKAFLAWLTMFLAVFVLIILFIIFMTILTLIIRGGRF